MKGLVLLDRLSVQSPGQGDTTLYCWQDKWDCAFLLLSDSNLIYLGRKGLSKVNCYSRVHCACSQ